MSINFNTIIKLFLVSIVIGVGASYGKIYLFHIMLIIIIFLFISFKFKNLKIKQASTPTKLHYIFYFMFLWYSFSVFWSIKIEYSLIYLGYLIFGLSIILTLVYYVNTLQSQNDVFRILSKVFIVEIIISLLEIFTNFRYPISPFSEYVYYFGREMKMNDLSEDEISHLMLSPTGFEWNPNNLAIVMLGLLPFFLLSENNKIKLFGFFSISTIIIMTTSRGAFIALFFMLFLYFFFLKRKIFLISLVVIPILGFSLFSSLAFLENSNNARVKKMLTSIDTVTIYLSEENSGKNSVGYRQELIHNGLNALRESYYIGVGGGASNAVQEMLGGVDGKLTSMHNFWIEILVEGGILFFTVFILWYIYIVYTLYKIGFHTKHEKYKFYSQSLFLSMLTFIPSAISASSVVYELPMWLLFGFSIANINNYKRYKNESIYASRS